MVKTVGSTEKEIANNHLQVSRTLYKLPGTEPGQRGKAASLSAQLLMQNLMELGCSGVLPGFGISVATTVDKWYRVRGSICSLHLEKCSYIQHLHEDNFASDSRLILCLPDVCCHIRGNILSLYCCTSCKTS